MQCLLISRLRPEPIIPYLPPFFSLRERFVCFRDINNGRATLSPGDSPGSMSRDAVLFVVWKRFVECHIFLDHLHKRWVIKQIVNRLT